MLPVQPRPNPAQRAELITFGAAVGAGHWHGVNGGVVFDVEGFEDVAAVGATE